MRGPIGAPKSGFKPQPERQQMASDLVLTRRGGCMHQGLSECGVSLRGRATEPASAQSRSPAPAHAGGQELEEPNPFSSIQTGVQKRKKRKWKEKELERKPFR